MNSNVSPKIGLKGFANDFSISVHYVAANTEMKANLLEGSLSSIMAA